MNAHRFTILLVDDNEANRYAIGSLLNRRVDNCQVVEVASGTEALAATLEQQVDLILLDIQMPFMDGYETARHLKMIEQTRDIPIIFITAVFLAEEFFKRGYKVGAVDYLTKPVDENLLLNRVKLYQRLLERESRLREAMAKIQRQDAMMIHQSRMVALGEMVGAIAHQWRQPLNNLAMVMQDLQDADKFGELDREYLERSVQTGMCQIDHMSKTIDDFRTFFRPDQDRIPFRIQTILQEAVRLVREQFQRQEITIHLPEATADPENHPNCHGFPGELKQVLLNLLLNAKDAILDQRKTGELPSPSSWIQLTLEITPEGNRIMIEDNGGGIRSEIVHRVFDPFFTTKGDGKGSGIGLYMSRTIVEEHMNGRLYVANTTHGARFVIELPAAPDPQSGPATGPD